MYPIVLIHGFPFDGGMWDEQAGYLRSAEGGGHEVWVPDLAGFGRSEKAAPAKGAASVEGYAEEVYELILKNGGKAIVGGFSMGGYVLLALLRAHREVVAGVMLVDTRADADGGEARATRLKAIEGIEADAGEGKRKLIDGMMEKVLGRRPAEVVKGRVRAMMERQSAGALVAGQSAMLRRRDQSDLLSELKMPVLIVVGAEDGITPPSVAVGMQTLMPEAMLVQIVSAGHLSPVEQPGAVNGAIKAFLATVKGERAVPVAV